VVHLVGFPIDVNGNLQRALYEAIHLSDHGVKVKFVLSEDVINEGTLEKSIPKSRLYELKLKVYPVKPLIPHSSVGWRINNLIPLFIEGLRISQLFNKSIIHVHAPTPITKPLSASLIKKFLKAPIVMDLHDPWSGHPFSYTPIQLLQTGIMRYAISNADVVVTAHRALMDLVRAINQKTNVALIPNGVDADIFRPIPPSQYLIREFKISSHETVIAFCGHLTEEKGLDLLIEAAKIITKHNKAVKFLIIGEGPNRNKLEILVENYGLKNYFIFTGFLKTEVLIEYLSLADICVAPYKPMPHYGVMKIETPLKVVQYMAMGKPVVMSRVSEENVVSWSNGGMLIDPGDPKKLADALTNLVEDQKARKIMGRRGRDYVEHNLRWSSIAEKLSEIYKSLL
jgi:glycosyltransferase involved in cell wall biosynthesis